MARHFTWEAFDDETVCAIAKALLDFDTDDGPSARCKLNAGFYGHNCFAPAGR